VTMQYPEEKWVVPEGYRGAPYLVKDQEGRTKCVSCQLCEFVCPPKAIRNYSAWPRRRSGSWKCRESAERVRDQHASLHFLRVLPGSLPRRSHLFDERLFPDGTSRDELIYNKEKLLALAVFIRIRFANGKRRLTKPSLRA